MSDLEFDANETDHYVCSKHDKDRYKANFLWPYKDDSIRFFRN